MPSRKFSAPGFALSALGTPSGAIRLASRLASGAVAALARGKTIVLVSMIHNRLTPPRLAWVDGAWKLIDPELFALAKILGQWILKMLLSAWRVRSPLAGSLKFPSELTLL
jgi:hypothetical protein